MYLDELSDLEKTAFARLAYLLISYYGIDDHELKLYYSALAEMGVGEPEMSEEIDIALECSVFDSQASRRIALLELMRLALADGNLEDEEQHLLDVIINAFQFDEDTLNAAWDWVRGWYGCYQAGRELIHPPVLAEA